MCKVWWPRKITNKQLLDRTNQDPAGQRKQGRPLHSWKRTRMKEMDNIGKTWGEAKKTAQNSEMESNCSGPILHKE